MGTNCFFLLIFVCGETVFKESMLFSFISLSIILAIISVNNFKSMLSV